MSKESQNLTSRPLSDGTGWLAFFLSASRNPTDPMKDVLPYFDELEKLAEKEKCHD